jgi:resuscitation-promoting factor RpfB
MRKRALGALAIAIAAYAASHAAASGHTVTGGGTTTSNRQLAVSLAASEYDWTGSQATCLVDLWTSEDSTWSPTQWNLQGSGAYGIPQALPADKMASAGADWQTDPATQIKWGLGYVADRYGSPCGAWTFKQNNGWY